MRINHGIKLEDGTLEIILPLAPAVKRVIVKSSISDGGIIMEPREVVDERKDKEYSGNTVTSCSISFKQGS